MIVDGFVGRGKSACINHLNPGEKCNIAVSVLGSDPAICHTIWPHPGLEAPIPNDAERHTINERNDG